MPEDVLTIDTGLFGIWCFDRGGWMVEILSQVTDFEFPGIVVYNKRDLAERRAAVAYGYETYADAHKEGWVEVRRFDGVAISPAIEINNELCDLRQRVTKLDAELKEAEEDAENLRRRFC